MNTDQDMKNCCSNSASDDRSPGQRVLPFIYLLLFLAVALLWSYCCGGCLKKDGSGSILTADSKGIGGRQGSGSGNAGKSSGAGTSGSNQGKTQHPPIHPSAGDQKNASPAASPVASDRSGSSRQNQNGTASGKVLPPDRQVEYLTSIHHESAAGKFSGNSSAAGRKGFYGVDTSSSTRSIFIVDTSTSMGAASSELPGKSRMDVLKLELTKSLSSSGSKYIGGFVILAFNGATTRFPDDGKLCRYRKTESMKEARDFIQKMRPSGGTMMRQVWRQAIQIASQQKIDTIYFMTDGKPGDEFSDQWLLPQLNRHGLDKIKIHCVSIGDNEPFMQKIAVATRGEYIHIP